MTSDEAISPPENGLLIEQEVSLAAPRLSVLVSPPLNFQVCVDLSLVSPQSIHVCRYFTRRSMHGITDVRQQMCAVPSIRQPCLKMCGSLRVGL